MLNYCRKHGLQVENNRNHFFPVPNTGLLLRARGFFFFFLLWESVHSGNSFDITV